jgi:hypothetical protein
VDEARKGSPDVLHTQAVLSQVSVMPMRTPTSEVRDNSGEERNVDPVLADQGRSMNNVVGTLEPRWPATVALLASWQLTPGFTGLVLSGSKLVATYSYGGSHTTNYLGSLL